jgi:uncharacterized protein YlaI
MESKFRLKCARCGKETDIDNSNVNVSHVNPWHRWTCTDCNIIIAGQEMLRADGKNPLGYE